MGLDDKAENKFDEAKGQVKETTGRATDIERVSYSRDEIDDLVNQSR